jgi:hypothetical protein
MTKTLGQIAYEAFHADPLVPAELIRHWYSQAKHEHEAWQAAAEAVTDSYREQRATTFDERITKEHAVIEAAKKWRTDLAFDEMTSENAYVLYAAIMDLEAAEKEER